MAKFTEHKIKFTIVSSIFTFYNVSHISNTLSEVNNICLHCIQRYHKRIDNAIRFMLRMSNVPRGLRNVECFLKRFFDSIILCIRYFVKKNPTWAIACFKKVNKKLHAAQLFSFTSLEIIPPPRRVWINARKRNPK